MSDKDELNVPAAKLPHFEKPIDFRASFHWRVFRIMAEFVDGFQFWRISKTVTSPSAPPVLTKKTNGTRKPASWPLLAQENIGVISEAARA